MKTDKQRTNPIHFRKARDADQAFIRALLTGYFTELSRYFTGPEQRTQSSPDDQAGIILDTYPLSRQDSFGYYIALERRNPIAILLLSIREKVLFSRSLHGFIDCAYTMEKYRHQGIMRGLFQYATEIFAASVRRKRFDDIGSPIRIDQWELTVLEGNTPALRLWKSLGFAPKSMTMFLPGDPPNR